MRVISFVLACLGVVACVGRRVRDVVQTSGDDIWNSRRSDRAPFQGLDTLLFAGHVGSSIVARPSASPLTQKSSASHSFASPMQVYPLARPSVHSRLRRSTLSSNLIRDATKQSETQGSLGPSFDKAEQTPERAQFPELDEWREFEKLRGQFDAEVFNAFFRKRPMTIASRLVEVFTTLNKARSDWDSANATEIAEWKNLQKLDPVKFERGEVSGTARGKRLCDALASLGPVSVKIAQTLSQRPDIVGDEVATALKRLQTASVPFDDKLAWAVVKESLNWRGQIAPGVGASESDDPDMPPLFASISESPVAVASLGQVYKALTHEGMEVAVKVQRPEALATLAKDYVSFATIFEFLRVTGIFVAGDVQSVVERVAFDVLDELDYEKEAKNAARFQESLDFLGFVTTPPVFSKYSAQKVLVTEWVQGQPLNKLPVEEGLQMVRMAVEACTASLILTGYVHADPHEGNLMLADDGRLVFLDFGLMSAVEDDIMEAFARGIQACLAEDWYALAVAFKDTGFLNDPVRYKPVGQKQFIDFGIDPVTGEDLGLTKFTQELAEAMKNTEGGTSRFGALADILNNQLSPRWKMFTPPYILLLIRTFLTLEGIAAQVDPEFNIYEMAMPWAVRRLLSPSSSEGVATFRSTVLTPGNRVQWSRLLDLVTNASTPDTKDEAVDSKMQSTEDARANALNDAVGTLLGSPSGGALRRALMDVDSTDLFARLVSKEARALRHAAALGIAGSISKGWKARLATNRAGEADAVVQALETDYRRSRTNNVAPKKTAANISRPTSQAALLLKERQARWQRKVTRLLVQTHLRRQFRRGLHGIFALGSLAYLSVRIALGTLRQTFLQIVRMMFNRFNRKGKAAQNRSGTYAQSPS